VRHGLSLLRPLAALSQLLTGCTLQLLTPVGGEDVIMHKNVCGWAAVAAAAASAALRRLQTGPRLLIRAPGGRATRPSTEHECK